MQEYEKKYAQKSAQQNNAAPIQAKTNGIPNSVLNDVFAGKRHADSSMMGHSQNLAPSIAAKMSRAFGMDLTGMQVYQSDTMKGTGMQGMAQGNKVVLSSEVNLNTTAGQAVLGHEISHIHAQSQGVGMGHSGLYENAALEHQADTEGLLAAQGRSIYSDGMDAGIGMQYGLGMKGVEGLTPLSGGMSANAGAPMQAWKFGDMIKNLFSKKSENAGNPEADNNQVENALPKEKKLGFFARRSEEKRKKEEAKKLQEMQQKSNEVGKIVATISDSQIPSSVKDEADRYAKKYMGDGRTYKGQYNNYIREWKDKYATQVLRQRANKNNYDSYMKKVNAKDKNKDESDWSQFLYFKKAKQNNNNVLGTEIKID